jgi:hypothetical protein
MHGTKNTSGIKNDDFFLLNLSGAECGVIWPCDAAKNIEVNHGCCLMSAQMQKPEGVSN